MIGTFRRAYDQFFGVGEFSISIPIFDGALKPNDILENAEVVFRGDSLNDLAVDSSGQLYAANGTRLLRIASSGESRTIRTIPELDKPIRAIAAFADGIAIATANEVIVHDGSGASARLDSVDGRPLTCVNAVAADDSGQLFVSEGSSKNSCEEWSRDLLEHGSTGRVIEYDPASGDSRVLASGLKYCCGVASDGQRVFVAESWRHRIVDIDGANTTSVVSELPGYPGRISGASDGGYWLSIFAARTQLLEQVLRDDNFRRDMMREVEPQYWVAPALSSGGDFLEPAQFGGIRTMGILKPWAPPRSYGLVVRYDADWRPLYSLHSRVGGDHHGIVAAVEHGGELYVLSKGASCILRIPLDDLKQQDFAV